MPGRPWGQHFLKDQRLCQRIVAALNLGPTDRVVEIGPGKGALTRELCPSAGRVWAVEVDPYLAKDLPRRLGFPLNLQVENQNALEVGWPAWSGAKVVGNLPYNVATAILQHLMSWSGWQTAVVMVQKEVAERMVAKPGGKDFGLLSLAVQSRAEAKSLFHLSPGAFKPPPRVVSTVVQLTRREQALLKDEAQFFRVARAAFGQRRKMLVNSLAAGLSLEKVQVVELLRGVHISPEVRPETLSLEDYRRLAEAVAEQFPGASAAV